MITSRRMRVFGMLMALIASCCASASTWADSDLLVAARRGDLFRVKTLLGAKADVNETRRDGATALMAASTTGHLAVVKALLAAKADVSARM
ncbi:MAG: ankyrin repeat domain-containing protein, partial [Nitrosospira sp.]